jgi:hypothetical protein
MTDEEKEYIEDMLEMKMPVEYMLGYRPDKCMKPDCLCIDIAVANNGGREIKNYPCLAKVEPEQLKQPK